eukprot:TRINITY_DN616_c0_g1_i1.p1 TRINITY_DN616_c0_g1~~TRINITY_DN616_c0_g1_i1.p1  ORF type:complete len:911 (+),score=274.64 TRINITY_DN616_c0_g1_i1:64-2796(+)
MSSTTQKELKEGLMLNETVLEDGEKQLSVTNTTIDKQFICKYTFKGGEPEPLGITKIEGGKWIVSVHPGETQEFVKGKWTGLTKSIATGPPSKEWLEKQAGAAKDANTEELKKVEELIEKNKLGKTPKSEDVATACEKEKIKFVDTNFLPLDNSLQAKWQKGEMKMFPFKRPADWECLVEAGLKPELFVNKIEPADVNQGSLADCYLMGALGSVAQYPDFVKFLFSDKQNPDLGIYRVKLCKNAWWETVVMDDFLPCSGPKPAFARNRDEINELWVALVEKAYSKANGSYFAMKTGQCAAALADLTGCPHRTTPMSDDLWETMLKQSQEGVLQVLGTPGKNLMYVEEAKQAPDDKKLWDQYREVELICEHSYSVLKCLETKCKKRLVKLRNPWGTTVHGLWKGDWSLDDKKWTPELKKEVGWDESDGVFWMCWEDCAKWFNSVSVGFTQNWESIRVAGAWKDGVPDVCIELDVKKPTQMWVGLHQSDTRGIQPGSSPDASYVSMNLFVVAPKKDGVKVVESYGTAKRDRFGLINLDPEQNNKLFFVGMPKLADTNKKFVLSMHIEDTDAVEVFFNGSKGASHCETAKDINLENWVPTAVQFQISGKRLTGGKVENKKGKQLGSAEAATREVAAKPKAKKAAKEETDEAESPKKPAAKKATAENGEAESPKKPAGKKAAVKEENGEAESPKKPAAKKAAVKDENDDEEAPKKPAGKKAHVDPEAPKARIRSGSDGPKAASAGAKATLRSKTTAVPAKEEAPAKAAPKPAPKKPNVKRDIRVEVEIHGAKGLSSKGSQNPFCEVKLRAVQGGVVQADHSNPQKQTTKVVNKNLSPSWNEKYTFTVPSTDCIRVSIFGKKMMGKDYLGRVDLMAPDILELTEEDKGPIRKTYAVTGEDKGPVSGTMDISVKLL